MDWEQILSFLSPDSLLSQTPLTKLDLEQMWCSIYFRWPSAKYHKETCSNKAEFSFKKVRLPFVQATQVELCDITGGWKPRVPCHHPTHTTLASTAIIWKGDKVAPALCATSCSVHISAIIAHASRTQRELNHSALTLIWLIFGSHPYSYSLLFKGAQPPVQEEMRWVREAPLPPQPPTKHKLLFNLALPK